MWNYRVIKFDDHVGLYEVIYNDQGEISGHCEKPEVVGDTVEELGDTLKLMLHDYERSDVLDGEKIEFAPLVDPDDKLIPFDLKNADDSI